MVGLVEDMALNCHLKALTMNFDFGLGLDNFNAHLFLLQEHSPEGVPVSAMVNFRFGIFSSEPPKDL